VTVAVRDSLRGCTCRNCAIAGAANATILAPAAREAEIFFDRLSGLAHNARQIGAVSAPVFLHIGGCAMDDPENGGERAAMTCRRCGIMSTILFGPEPAGFIDQLPDPFEWQCRFCGHRNFYAKAEIKVMTPEHEAKPFVAP
jgi:hypothetical protein